MKSKYKLYKFQSELGSIGYIVKNGTILHVKYDNDPWHKYKSRKNYLTGKELFDFIKDVNTLEFVKEMDENELFAEML